LPMAAVEFAATHVAGARIERRSGRPTVIACAVEPLPSGALVASLASANLVDRPVVAGAVGRVLDQLERPRRLAIVIPDLAGKISLLKFQQVPARARELEQLVRWQLRKTAPFAVEEAQVSYVPSRRDETGQEFLVSMARRQTIEEYEGVVGTAGVDAGVVDLATPNVANAVLAGADRRPDGTADWLLVNVSPGSAALAIFRGPDVLFFRSREAGGEGTLADLVHQTAMYYQDRLGGTGFTRVVLAGAGGGAQDALDTDLARRSLEERLDAPVEALDVRTAVAFSDRIADAGDQLQVLTPVVGILLRGQEPAA
ncbi:MAG: pilus assembly protein PilM, partial [Acidobacteriota bacterium]